MVAAFLGASVVAAAFGAWVFWDEQRFTLDGTDPSSTSCLQGTYDAGQKTIANAQGVPIATVTIRYSVRCETNWVSVENTARAPTS